MRETYVVWLAAVGLMVAGMVGCKSDGHARSEEEASESSTEESDEGAETAESPSESATEAAEESEDRPASAKLADATWEFYSKGEKTIVGAGGEDRKTTPSEVDERLTEVTSIELTGDGGAWLGLGPFESYGPVLFRDGRVEEPKNSPIEGDELEEVGVAPDGTVWFAGEGLARRMEDGGWHVVDATKPGREGLRGFDEESRVYEVAFDGEGAVIFGAHRGVVRFDGETWETLHQGDGIRVKALAVASPSDIWFAEGKNSPTTVRHLVETEEGWSVEQTFDTANWSLDEQERVDIQTIHVDAGGTVWMGLVPYATGGLIRLDPDGSSKRFERNPRCATYDIDSDSAGRLWMATLCGVVVYDPSAKGAGAWASSANSSLVEWPAKAIEIAENGDVWVGFSRRDRGFGIGRGAAPRSQEAKTRR